MTHQPPATPKNRNRVHQWSVISEFAMHKMWMNRSHAERVTHHFGVPCGSSLSVVQFSQKSIRIYIRKTVFSLFLSKCRLCVDVTDTLNSMHVRKTINCNNFLFHYSLSTIRNSHSCVVQQVDIAWMCRRRRRQQPISHRSPVRYWDFRSEHSSNNKHIKFKLESVRSPFDTQYRHSNAIKVAERTSDGDGNGCCRAPK